MADRTSDPAEEPADGDGGEGAGTTERADDSGSGGRPDGAESPDGDVVVPLRLYKTVTVFSTLFAIAAILAGFVLMDRGTQRATASPEEVSLPLVARWVPRSMRTNPARMAAMAKSVEKTVTVL